MAKKQKQQERPAATTPEQTDDVAPLNNLYDTVAVKHRLDEHVIRVIIEDEGYPANMALSNTKLLLMFLAVAVGALTQFLPETHPLHGLVIVVGPLVYFALSSLFQLIVWFYEKDCILETNSSGEMNKKKIIVRTRMPKYSEFYTCKIEQAPDSNKGPQKIYPVAEMTESIGKYFTEDGQVVEKALRDDVVKLLKQIESKQQ